MKTIIISMLRQMRGPMFSQFNPPYLHTPTQPPREKEEMDMASQELKIPEKTNKL